MPHLDAEALTRDVDGLQFLKAVLDAPADAVRPPKAFPRSLACSPAKKPIATLVRLRMRMAEPA